MKAHALEVIRLYIDLYEKDLLLTGTNAYQSCFHHAVKNAIVAINYAAKQQPSKPFEYLCTQTFWKELPEFINANYDTLRAELFDILLTEQLNTDANTRTT